MRDELPDWMDAPSDDAPGPDRRLRRLLLLAAVPWVVVAGLVFRASGDGRAPDPPRPAAGDAAAEATDEADLATAPETGAGTDPTAVAPPGGAGSPASDPDAADGDAVGEPALEELLAVEWQAGWHDRPGDGATVATATAVARAWFTGVGPSLAIDGIAPTHADGYAEHLTVEALERPAPGAAVVTIAAIVLHAGDDAEVRLHRLAVPVDETRDEPRPAGRPWPLPTRDPEVSTPTPTDELGREHWPAAERALSAAGYAQAELRGLQRTDGWPVLASVRTEDGDQVVWLRRHLHDFVVAGLPLSEARPGEAEPAEPPPDGEDQDDHDETAGAPAGEAGS
ncbi:hypothetical protein [Egicoccus sp. AB-alg2]|uniref:hypothetical protein n=1 Tax=Egicoccus sp. AB-alg2 TaxID=3242693 RepID=UPI00359DE240